jgi:hypothetical protein
MKINMRSSKRIACYVKKAAEIIRALDDDRETTMPVDIALDVQNDLASIERCNSMKPATSEIVHCIDCVLWDDESHNCKFLIRRHDVQDDVWPEDFYCKLGTRKID